MSSRPRDSRGLAGRKDLQVSHLALLDDEDWSFKDADTQYLLHSLHPYPARFIPQIPKRAIQRWSKAGELVLDPFCGCGTTILECALNGRNSIGVDNNAIATLVTSAKVEDYLRKDFADLEQLVKELHHSYWSGTVLAEADRWRSYAPDYPNRGKWFGDPAILDLSWLRSRIMSLPERPRLLALAAFSAVVVRASRQDSDTRYAVVDRKYVPGYAVKLWLGKMDDAIPRAKLTAARKMKSHHEVVLADSRDLNFVPDRSVDLIVTSPPYLNTYDYHKYHRHRLHWIGSDVEFARDKEIGKHDTFTRPKATPTRYFSDMEQCMIEWVRVLKPGRRALIVVGDAIVSGQFVPVGDTLIEIAPKVGLSPEKRWVRDLNMSKKSFNMNSRIKREHLLLVRKTRAR